VPLGLPELPEDILNCLRVTEMEAGAKKNPCENFKSGLHQQIYKKLLAFLGFSGCRQS
jgi:hypothetical protein